MVKESACNARDLGSIPGSGRYPGGGTGNPIQYSCLENSMDRGAWQAKSMESESHVTEQLTLSLFCRENNKREQITSTLTRYWHLENAPCLLDSCSALIPHDSDTKHPQALESDQGLNTGLLSLNTGFIYHYHWLIWTLAYHLVEHLEASFYIWGCPFLG